MKELVQNFTKQLQEALLIAEKAVITKGNSTIKNVVITGLGGSGIGGTILSEIVSENCVVPIVVNKDYFIPNFVNENTLVIVSSYSGNTEETLNAFHQALTKKAQIVCVCSGGKILQLAKQHQLNFIEIPGGNPPRSCIGYSLVQLFKIFEVYNLAPSNLLTQTKNTIDLLNVEEKNIKEISTIIANQLTNKLTVIYTLGTCEGVAVRFRQQINENSKQLCWHHTFPEMNHNELVGWTEKNNDLVVVTFKTSFDYKRTQKRYEICKPLFEKLSNKVIDIEAKGSNKVEQFFYLINVGDWISCYIADNKNIDAVEVNVITNLKNELEKFS